MIQIWTDWTERGEGIGFEEGRVPLNLRGSLQDIRRQKVELREGLRIIVYDSELEAEAIVEEVEGKWWGRIVGSIRQMPEEEALKRMSLLDSKYTEGNDAIVVRGGLNTAQTLWVAGPWRVNSAPGMTVEQLTENLPHNRIGVTTVGDIRAIGGDVFSTPTKNNPVHATVFPGHGWTQELSGVFVKQFNPWARQRTAQSLDETVIRIYSDFNSRTSHAPEGSYSRFEGGSVPLFCTGGLIDIRKQKVELREGLRIIVYDDGCESKAVVEMVEGKWWGRIVGSIRQIPEEEEEEVLKRINLLSFKD